MATDNIDSTDASLYRTLRTIVSACGHVDLDRPQSLGALERFRSPNVLFSSREWEQVRDQFTVAETVALIQILTVMEREFAWPAGSVSCVIWMLRDLIGREKNIAGLVADWVVQRTRNDHLPLGSHTSRADWIRDRTPCLNLEASRDRGANTRERPGAGMIAARVRRARLLAEAAESAKAAYLVEKRQEDQALESAAPTAAPDGAGRLELVALDLNHELNFFPKEWAKVSHDDLLRLDAGVRAALVKRLETTRVVSWRRLYKRLIDRESGRGA
jgi:hypothetical protein